MAAICDFCGTHRSMVYCRSDAASLCLLCDRNVHSANALGRRHTRTLLCDRCCSQPAAVHCVEENTSLCQNCDWNGHGAASGATGHKRQAINCYSGCPSSLELSRIWSFVVDIPTVAAEPNCEDGISMTTIDDSDVTNHCGASDDKRPLEIASTTLMCDPPTDDKLKPLIGSSSGGGFNVVPLATDQPAGSVPMTPKNMDASLVDKVSQESSDVSLLKTLVVPSTKRRCTDKRTGDTSAVADMHDQVPGHEALERILNDASEEPIELPYALLQNITNDFSQVIGNGGFGVVYMGVLRNKKIAVKKLLQAGLINEKQFEDELKCLRRVKHKNIVRFVGYCSDTQEKVVEYNGQFVVAEERRRFLCFEYVPNKSLHDYLKDESHGQEWDIHYKLIDGICQGLCYLHIEERITHLDLKPENILLDVDMVPKITDFGLSRLFSIERSRIITKNIRGSWGYIAPEYWSKGEISFKSDIFSLGVILKKLLGGDNDSSNPENGHQSPDTDNPQVKRCFQIAQVCVDDDPRKRPTIDCIINMLSENKTD